MTVWEHLVANSTLAEAEGDAWEHLTNPSGEGGGGLDRLVPYGHLSLSVETGPMSVDIEKRVLEANIEKRVLEIDIETEDIDI